MSEKRKCTHNELMENFLEKDKVTGKFVVRTYRCVDCGKSIDANKITTIPTSKEYKNVFSIND